MSDSVSSVLEDMKSRFDPADWEGQNATLQFNITGDDAGQWYAVIQDGDLSVSEGEANEASMTMTCDSTDLMALVSGDLNAVSAFMQGRIKIDGNMSLAMKLQSLLG